jgi:hypothetical protein
MFPFLFDPAAAITDLESLAQTENDPVRALAASQDALQFLYRECLSGVEPAQVVKDLLA